MNERAVQWVAIGLVAALAAVAIVWVSQVQKHQNDGLHSIICFQESLIQNSHKLTVAQKRADLRLADKAIKVGRLNSCPTR